MTHFFILVNPKSGGNRASAFMKLGTDYFHLRSSDIHLHIYDITQGSSGEKPGFLKMKEVIDSHNIDNQYNVETTNNHLHHPGHVPKTPIVKLIVAGGDGTVMWAMSEVDAHHIDPQHVAIGILPFGTGNDFSRALGWGGGVNRNFIGDCLSGLLNLVEEWNIHAIPTDFDLWEVVIKVSNKIEKISSDGKKVPMLNENGELIKELFKPMCNYASVGIESRIGIGFDRNRTKSKTLNKVVYVVEGGKKMVLHRPLRVADQIDKIECGQDCLVNFKNLGVNPVSVIAINIPSFAGGCDIWKSSKQLKQNSSSPTNSDNTTTTTSIDDDQYIGDGKIELLAYESTFGLGSEQMKIKPFIGNGKRLHSGPGPMKFDFKQDIKETKRNYIQIDGEFFILYGPIHFEIRHLRNVVVLRRDVPSRTSSMSANTVETTNEVSKKGGCFTCGSRR